MRLVRWSRARALAPKLLTTAVVLGLVAAGVMLWVTGGRVTATAVFPSATSLYTGDDVRILGLKVGQVDEVVPGPDGVRVRFHYDAEHQVPADAKAVIVAPALVASRYVELTPAYTGGPVLADEATIPVERTAVPVEFDQIKDELNKLATALGPDGANSSGALTRLLDTGATYQGQGQTFHDTITQVNEAIRTLSDGRGDLFGTVRNLAVFVSALRASDEQITQFTSRLDTVAGTLNDNGDEFAAALTKLDGAATQVRTFLENNRSLLDSSTDQLTEVLGVVAGERDALAQALHVAPTVLANAYNIYDPLAGSFTGALQFANLQNPAQFVCSGIGAAAATTPVQAGQLCEQTLGPLLNLLQMTYPPVGANPLVRPGTPGSGTVRPTGPGTPAGPGAPAQPAAPAPAKTLGGLLGVQETP
ncbi:MULTISPECIES: MCE family protein [Amycolatopsis methanolica group]|uniref:MCE family protein n=1 Tax=Amycolatopsis methanolica 239 TaxID=1068978 RepID=A0A076N3Z6_AMYME|nr:MCE family protein [Amycolatopsis methanolica]AIJ24667.1 MCE family protein [Amycolatopsis methanolica 239]